MKKMVLLLLLLSFSLFMFASCSEKGENMFWESNDDQHADATFAEIINAIQNKDHSRLSQIFSKTIQEKCDLPQDALRLFEFINGDITSISSAADAGVGADYKVNNGKKKYEIQASFCIETTETRYYLAIKECIKDDFNNNNEGVSSIYIIKSSDWTEDYIYRVAGLWNDGINIIKKTEADSASS